MKKTTLCYIEAGGSLLMLHRTKKKNDENAGMYIGLGGHFLEGESPEDCVRREVYEESGLLIDRFFYRGIVRFYSDVYDEEEMHLFTASLPELKTLPECDEGELCLVNRDRLTKLKMWEGDFIFLSLLFDGADFFDLELRYKGDKLEKATLNGSPAELIDLIDPANGKKTGAFKERSLVHRDGDLHETVHIWIAETTPSGVSLLLQKRSALKESYPGLFDVSCAGHVSRGDTKERAAIRELREELGLDVSDDDLHFLGFFDSYRTTVFRGKPFRDNERAAVFLLDGGAIDADRLILEKNEVEEVRRFDAEDLMRRLPDPAFCLMREELAMVYNALTEPDHH